MNNKIGIIIVIFITAAYTNEFPYKQFFQFGNVEEDEENVRKSDFLCTVGDSWTSLCSCDKDCMKYQSCCIDHKWNRSINNSLSSYIKQFIIESRKYKQLKCTPIISGLDSKNSHVTESLLMVSKCPRDISRKMRHKCKQTKLDLNLLPVVGSDGYIYKNKYCAMCNRVKKFEYLKVKADCEGKIPYNDSRDMQKSKLDLYSDCRIDIVKEPNVEKIAKYCNSNVVSKCTQISINGPKNIDCRICKYYNAGVTTSSDRCCKNPHCCHEEFPKRPNSQVNPDICFDVFPKTARGVTMTRFGALPDYSILLTFKESKDFQDAVKDDICKPSDLSAPDCEGKFACPEGYNLIGSNCVLDKPRDLVSRVDSRLEGNCFDRFVYFIIKADKNDQDSILDHFNATHPKINHEVINRNQTHLVLKILESNYANITLHITRNIEYEIVKTSVPDIKPNVIYGMDFTRSFKDKRICASQVIHDENSFNISSNCFVTFNKSILNVNEYILVYKISKEQKTYLVTCNNFHLSEPCLLRTIRNYTVFSNNSIQTVRNITYEPGEYLPMKNSIGICVDKKMSNVWLDIVNAVVGYLTVIGCALSIIAYIWTILTYSMIKELRTTPGKNIICLCSMLLACDLLMLLSMMSAWCKYIAILLHFFALSAQFWSVITAFDIWATFQGKSLSRNLKSNKRFICYCLWGWITPLCFIVLCIILETANIVEVGYGKYNVCWITNLPARLVTYIVPVAISIIFTVTVLTFTMYRIFRQCNKSKTLLKKRGGDNVSLAVMALKLVILLGVIEIIGFLQFQGNEKISWIFTSIFQLIYVIIRSFRGVFVWLLYVVTDRVFKIYRNIRDQRSYRSTTTKLTPVRRTNPRTTRSYSTRSSDNFNTTLTIAPT